jgi:small-conductance mechanosensitive channel
MQIQRVKFLAFILIFAATFAAPPGGMVAQEAAPASSNEPAKPETGSPMTISDLVSGSTELSERLSALQRNLELGFDLPGFEEKLAKTEERLKALADRFKEMKTDGRFGYERLLELKAQIVESARALEKTWKPFEDRVKQVEHWNHKWSQGRESLLALESSLPKDESYKTIKPMIDRAKEAINNARNLILSNLNKLLAIENKAAGVQATADSLVTEIDGLLQTLRGNLFQKSAPSMFSSDFYGQFNTALGKDLRKGFEFVSASQWEILERKALLVVLEIAIFLILAVMIIRNRAALAAEPRLLFFAERAFSVAMLLTFVVFLPFYEAGLGIWRVVILAVAALCVARLSGCCIADAWRRRAVYGLVVVLIINEFLQLSDLPRPLFRLYVLLVSVISLLLCLWRVVNSASRGAAHLYRWTLWGGVIVSGTILVANVGGYSALGAHLLEASLRTILLFLLGWILMAFGRGSLERFFKSASVTQVPLLQKNAATIVNVLSRLLDLAVGALVTVYFLVAWGLYDDVPQAIRSVMSVGFTIGSWRANLAHLLAAVLCLYGAVLASRALQIILADEVFPRRGVERGVQLSMGRLLHYAIVLVGFLLALGILGVNFTNVTIIGGALGVGIGFGLQTIVNNFVSGLILLFERPVRVGDYIEIGGLWAEIKKIGLRATVVETFDRADVVVPNSDLISNQVTNWTRSNRLMRIRIPVGVAYGSDVPLVMKILLDCAEDNPSVVSTPKTQVFFRGFGESSLDFEIRLHILDIDSRFIVESEILQEIDRQFREAGVEIPFPQRDLHLRSVDEKAGKSLLGKDLRSSSDS